MTATFDELLAHRDWLRGLALSITRDDAVAADLEQETWVAALENPPADQQQPRAWLSRVLRNKAVDRHRSETRRRTREVGVAPPPYETSTADLVAEADLHRRVVGEVMELDDPYRTVIVLRYFHGRSIAECASRLSVPSETVRTRQRRALAQLRGRLERRDRRALAVLVGGSGALSKGSAAAGEVIMSATKKWVVAAVAVGIALVAFVAWPDAEDATTPDVADSTESAAAPADDGASRDREHVADGAAAVDSNGAAATAEIVPVERHALDIKVIYFSGHAVAGAEVRVARDTDPFEDGRDVRRFETGHGPLLGRVLTADADGEVRVEVVGPEPVYVASHKQPSGLSTVMVTPPKDDIVLRLRDRPSASLLLRLVDSKSREFVENFSATVGDPGPDGFFSGSTTARAIETSVYFHAEQTEKAVAIRLVEPRWPGQNYLELHMEPGKPYDVVLETAGPLANAAGLTVVAPSATSDPESVAVVGVVRDADGNTVDGALVFFGNEFRARGDEPFKPFEESRIRDGVRTGANGSFEIAGVGTQLTAYHDAHGARTVIIGAAEEITLPRAGRIEGVLVEPGGAPWAGVDVVLDRTETVTTDALGAFAFENVHVGTRGLFINKGERIYGANVGEGETVRLEFAPLIAAVSLDLGFGEDVSGDTMHVTLISTTSPGWCASFDRARESVVELKNVHEGAYHVFVHDRGVGHVEITGPTATVDFGDGGLLVKTEAPEVYVVPVGSGAFLEDYGGRLIRGKRVEGGAHFAPLLRGEYWVGIHERGVVKRVTIDGPDVEVSLDD